MGVEGVVVWWMLSVWWCGGVVDVVGVEGVVVWWMWCCEYGGGRSRECSSNTNSTSRDDELLASTQRFFFKLYTRLF